MAAVLLLIASLQSSIHGTVWWQTAGAAVVESASRDQCSLMLSNHGDAIMLTFGKSGIDSLLVSNPNWQTVKQSALNAAVVEIGSTFGANYDLLGTHSNAPTFAFHFQEHSPTLSDLAGASRIVVGFIDPSGPMLEFPLPKQQMPQLLTALHKCQAAIH